MYYLVDKAVKKRLHDAGYQINNEALATLDAKMDSFLNRLTKQFNGHCKRITPELVSLTSIK